jgi:DNA-binding CsgD family transcriptional regulator
VVVTALDDEIDGPLLTHPGLDVIALTGLDLDGVEALLRAHGADVADVDWWRQRSGGNPTALLRLLAHHRAGTQRPGPSLVPDDALEQTLRTLPPPVRLALDVLAVAEPLPASVVDILGRQLSDGGADLLGELLRTRLIEVLDDGGGPVEVRYVHGADAVTIVGRIRPLRLRAVVRTAVRAIAASADEHRPEALVRLVDLSLQVNEPVEIGQLRRAAATARDGHAGPVALRLARAAARASESVEDVRRWVDLAYEHGDDDGLTAALVMLDQLATTPATAHDRPDARVALGLARAERAFWRQADTDGALAALDGAIGWGRDDEVQAVRARVLAASGRSAAAVQIAQPLATSDDARVRAQAAAALGHAFRRRALPATAVNVIDDVLQRPTAADNVLLVSRQLLGAGRALALAEAGRWHDATGEAEAARARAERYDDRPGRAIAGLVLAAVQAERGHARAAIAGASAALAELEDLRQPAGVRWALSVVALASALAGDGAGAVGAAERLASLPAHPATLFSFVEPRARALALAATRPDAARRSLSESADRALALGDLGAGAHCLHELAVLGAPSAAAEALVRLGSTRTDSGTALRVAHVEALAARDADALGALGRAFAERGGDRWALECALTAATIAAERRDRRAADRWIAEAAEHLGRCPGLARPAQLALHLSGAVVRPLTRRERDVAELAARGRSSREIASELGLSARTVDNHLSACFDKLHVRSRADLAAVLFGEAAGLIGHSS